MRSRRLRVRTKLVLLSVLIFVVVSFGFTTYDVLVFRQWIEEDLQEQAIVFAREIAVAIGDRPELAGSRRLDATVRRLRQVRPQLQRLDILVFEGEGLRLAASSARDAFPGLSTKEAEEIRLGRVISRLVTTGGERHWDVRAPIAREYGVIGVVAARFSSERVDRATHLLAVRNFSLTATSVTVMVVLMGLAVRVVVDRPVRRFMEAIGKIRDGTVDATVEVRSADEFSELADHFNAMMARVNQFSGELQVRVAEATRELDQRYEQVQQLNTLLFELQRKLVRVERLALSGRLMAEVAHEVGTPLHSVFGHLELLKKDLPAALAQDGAGRRLAVIETQLGRVIEIITRLLDVTRRPPEAQRPVDLAALVVEMAELVGPTVTASGLTLVVTQSPDLPVVLGHPDQLQQVVLNLLTNAMDATPPGGRIELATRAVPGEGVEIVVTDSGPGIPEADRQQIFEPFFSTKDARGTGLGLFITAQIVRDHRGRIEVDSPEGEGATVRVVLPAMTG